ncbi:MAG TPA: hypothetical protein VMF55_15990 [Solirubrobacterales bacterium]|nr:hypothetical protein [Solirubrobacterales bacterium]
MHSDNALQELEELEPVPRPGPGPTYDHIVGNQLRYTVKVLRYERYRRRRRKLEKPAAKQREEESGCDLSIPPTVKSGRG